MLLFYRIFSQRSGVDDQLLSWFLVLKVADILLLSEWYGGKQWLFWLYGGNGTAEILVSNTERIRILLHIESKGVIRDRWLRIILFFAANT